MMPPDTHAKLVAGDSCRNAMLIATRQPDKAAITSLNRKTVFAILDIPTVYRKLSAPEPYLPISQFQLRLAMPSFGLSWLSIATVSAFRIEEEKSILRTCITSSIRQAMKMQMRPNLKKFTSFFMPPQTPFRRKSFEQVCRSRRKIPAPLAPGLALRCCMSPSGACPSPY